MKQGQPPSGLATDRFTIWAVIAGVAVVALAVVLASPLDQATRETVSAGARLSAGVAAAISCGARARRSTGRRRRAWTLLSLGGVVGLVGNLYSGLVGDPTTGDTAYILALLLGVAGLAFFPTVRPRGSELVRMLLDSVVVGGSVLYIAVFAVVLGDSWETGSPFTTYALPVVDALLATLAVLVLTRSSATERVPLVLVGSGFVLYAVSDVAFALLSAGGEFSFGSPVDVGWVGGYVAIALAARHRAASGSPVLDRRADGSPVLGTAVTFLIFLAAAVVRVGQAGADVRSTATILWVVVLVAVVTRQILVVVDNESLRHGLEHRVEERTAQLRSLASERERTLESVGDGIYGVDSRGCVTFVNAAGARALGRSPEGLVGLDAHATFHAPSPDGTPYPADRCYITEAVRDGVTTTAEQDLYRRIDGKDVPVEVTAGPLRDDGTIRGAVVVFRDVTERARVEQIKDEFVSVVSHELRTPLTSIRGALGLLDSGMLDESPEQAARMMQIALRSSERLNRLVDDILDVERMDSGTTPLALADHRVDELVSAAVEQVTIMAGAAGVTVESTATTDVVEVDGGRAVQALTNLLSNAVKFSPRGGTVRVSSAADGDLVEIHVDDQGRGIPADKLEAVFRRFEQVDTTDARELGGTGLGLAIVHSIVERHGGRVRAVSDGVGKGSSFRVTLPRAHTPARRGGALDEAPTTGSASHVVAAGGRRAGAMEGSDLPVLVVIDDDAFVVEVLRKVLGTRGYAVVGVTDGRDALAVVAAARPSAIILDLAMPGTDGMEVLTSLRRSDATARIPVVVLTGTERSRSDELAPSVDGWLVKPVDPERLVRTVDEAVRLRPRHARVLLVADDDDPRGAMAAALEGAGLVVAPTRSAAEGRAAVAGGFEPDVVVLDLALPGGSGREFVADLRQDGRFHQTSLLVYSSGELRAEEQAGLRLGHTLFLGRSRDATNDVLRPVLDLLGAAVTRETHDGGPADPVPRPPRYP